MDHGTHINQALAKIKKHFESSGRKIRSTSVEIDTQITFVIEEIVDARGNTVTHRIFKTVRGSIPETLEKFDI